MPAEDCVHDDRARAESFGTVAEQYDRYRPSYPAELLDDLAALRPRDVLDVGCGTGKAAVLLAQRGLSVLGVEIDERMAGVARSYGLQVEVGAFEDWDDAGRRYDLLTCAQAWHWVDPQAGVAKAARVLRPGGTAALFWNYDDLDDSVQAVLDEVYRTHAPELLQSVVRGGSKQSERPHAEVFEASPDFVAVRTQRYQWQRTFTPAEWIGMVRTHSDHLLLPPERLTTLIAAVHDALAALAATFTTRYQTYAIFAERASLRS